ncbi:tyrosine aminotransferase-like [Octopus sinensis]|uniref:Tyrosine aminotransferase n=1 Tax=Octopus sinensis TaxID=2607531 RepID=A0A6P7TM54_9MOLL|nr:tyrosine aminotransferase-like [Octopus sinensis]
MNGNSGSWVAPASDFAHKSINPIRRLVDTMKLVPNKDKDKIVLTIGDPTVYGNMCLPQVAEDAVVAAIQSKKYNGYGPSVGLECARKAVAAYESNPSFPVDAKDVILTSGCSSAIDLCITVLANKGQNILVPRPGFSLYKTVANSVDIEIKFYNLLPEKSWEADLSHLESTIDENTVGIVIINPSNPCGSVYSKSHIKDILSIASKYRLPIIADEVYRDIVFHDQTFHSMASLSTDVPVLTCSGIAKRFLVPGWRMGWIVINDRGGVFEKEIRGGLLNLSQKILGPCTLVQGALPTILKNTEKSFFDSVITIVEENAKFCHESLLRIPGLKPVMPQGALYMMVGIQMEHFPDFPNDQTFVEQLVEEQSVFCLPASCFQMPNYFRLVLTLPHDKVQEALGRISEYCAKYYSPLTYNSASSDAEK